MNQAGPDCKIGKLAAKLISAIFGSNRFARGEQQHQAVTAQRNNQRVTSGGRRRRKSDLSHEGDRPWAGADFERYFGRPDPRPLHKRYDAAQGLSLDEARIYYGDEYDAERAARYRLEGYALPLEYDPWDHAGRAEHEFYSMQLRIAEARLGVRLLKKLRKGALFATGFPDGDPLDSPPSRISADRWRVLEPEFETSTATGSGVAVSGILVFHPGVVDDSQGIGGSGRYSERALRSWYQLWIETHREAGTIPSRDEDWAAAKEALKRSVPRDAVRRLRNELAPEHWVRRGRRKDPRR